MPLPASGVISAADIRTELELSGAVDFNTYAYRRLANKSTLGSAVLFSDFYSADFSPPSVFWSGSVSSTFGGSVTIDIFDAQPSSEWILDLTGTSTGQPISPPSIYVGVADSNGTVTYNVVVSPGDSYWVVGSINTFRVTSTGWNGQIYYSSQEYTAEP